MNLTCDSHARHSKPRTPASKRGAWYIFSPEIDKLLIEIERQGKMDLLIHNLNLVIEAAKNGMDMEKYHNLLKQPGVCLADPGKTEELIAQCM